MKVLLVRHAEHALAGRALAGRLPGVGLNERGREQARALGEALAASREPPTALYSSPQPRTRETAQALAARLGLPVELAPAFDEIDFGEWTGRSFEELRAQDADRWACWCDQRSRATPPGGEPFAQVAERAHAGLEQLARRHPSQVVAVVSHADVIKALIAMQLGLSLDALERLEIGCASVSAVEMGLDASGAPWSRVLALNASGWP
nr:histidine phosphatase family protein [Ramlibacter aurantiacus]